MLEGVEASLGSFHTWFDSFGSVAMLWPFNFNISGVQEIHLEPLISNVKSTSIDLIHGAKAQALDGHLFALRQWGVEAKFRRLESSQRTGDHHMLRSDPDLLTGPTDVATTVEAILWVSGVKYETKSVKYFKCGTNE